MKRTIISLLAAATLILVSCTENHVPNVQAEFTINGLSEDHWTYFSFEKGSTVGSSSFMDKEEDAQWSKRTDWDIAICGDYLKTNSGTSAIGSGGILKDETSNFMLLEEAPESGYLEDEIGIVKE